LFLLLFTFGMAKKSWRRLTARRMVPLVPVIGPAGLRNDVSSSIPLRLPLGSDSPHAWDIGNARKKATLAIKQIRVLLSTARPDQDREPGIVARWKSDDGLCIRQEKCFGSPHSGFAVGGGEDVAACGRFWCSGSVQQFRDFSQPRPFAFSEKLLRLNLVARLSVVFWVRVL